MKFSMTGQDKSDLLIHVTAYFRWLNLLAWLYL